MPKGYVERNTFVKGLITEASPLTYPENASIDEDNMVLNRQGSRRRRKGMDFESSYTLRDCGLTLADFVDYAITSYRWENVDNNASVSFLVVQLGAKLYFFDAFQDILSSTLTGTVALSDFASAYSGQFPIQYAVINGKLIIANQEFETPYQVTYSGSAFSTSQIDIKVRDIWGLQDNLDIDERPASLSSRHQYNLHNQGWPLKTIRDTSGNMRLAHIHFKNQTTVYPSNADIWYFAQQPDGSLIKFEGTTLESKWFGKTPAPKGHFIIDLFNRSSSRSSESGVSQPTDATEGGFTTVAAYSNRIFYSGVVVTSSSNVHETAPDLSSVVAFSKIVTSDTDLGKCHSENDPTSSEISDPLATDGGTFIIPEASRILKLVNRDNSLLVIAENGVWEVTGPDGVFAANDYSIGKVTNIGATNAESIVNAEGVIYYWSKAGIYMITGDSVSNKSVAVNITETTIQSFYISIPSVGRTNAIGRYDSDARKISWLYNDSASYDGVTQKNKYNRELSLDLVLNAFYTSTIGETATDSPYVAGFAPTAGFNTTDYSQNVVVNGEQVQVNGEDVVVTKTYRSRGSSSTKYIAVKPNSTGNVTFTFSLYNNASFLDWELDDSTGVDASAYLVTGYELFNDTMRKKQVPYLFMHFEQTEDAFVVSGTDLEASNQSSCLVSARWDFADNTISGKYGTQFQAYRLNRNYTPAVAGDFEYGVKVVTTKNKLRGIGRSFSMRIDTEAGKDLHLYGWGLSVRGPSNV